jgi:hypothetical protein
VVDADTGFGNALNMVRTVRLLERAGADALQIEDQVFPKRCGHFSGKHVIPAAEMVQKVKAAVDAGSRSTGSARGLPGSERHSESGATSRGRTSAAPSRAITSAGTA